MKKTTTFALAVAVLAAALTAPRIQADAGPVLAPCLKNNSTLCPAVGSVFDFEEDNDRTRFDSVGGAVAVEPDGYSVARRTGKLGFAADFAGSDNSWLRIPGIRSIGPGFWTATAWVYPDVLGSGGQKQTLLANDFKNQQATHVYLENVSGSLYLKISITTAELDTTIIATSGTALTVGAWNFVTFGASSFPSIDGQAIIFAQANNAAKGTASLTYFPLGINTETYLGARVSQTAGSRTPFDGGLDQLSFFGDALNPTQVMNLHNGGAGLAFPFVDPAIPFTAYLYPNGENYNGGYAGTYTDTVSLDANFPAGTGFVRGSGYYLAALQDPPSGATYNWIKIHVYVSPVQGGGGCPSVFVSPPPVGYATAVINVEGNIVQGGSQVNIDNYFNYNTWSWGCTGSSASVYMTYQWNVNPITGLAWTYNDIVNLGAGFGGSLAAMQGGWAQNTLDQVYVEVNGQYGF